MRALLGDSMVELRSALVAVGARMMKRHTQAKEGMEQRPPPRYHSLKSATAVTAVESVLDYPPWLSVEPDFEKRRNLGAVTEQQRVTGRT